MVDLSAEMPVDFVPKHNRENAKGSFARGCRVCQKRRGVIRSYGLNMCRRCFRERATVLGFKKYD
ncbi:40S ribosomal protein S29A [Tritrichomonas foetus]|uniref:40S ribosomal protein S29A n=2 Tax=Tritrichomonas foetus TaxID=1144522 RepID=A0A1J4JB52_9EUKA|nr:40S ribosomal protein S29A [Tritrichomonas foetus]|eukprot:OHS94476.1 40S ribosomal protein S29A [Tritrichomonas foetus]